MKKSIPLSMLVTINPILEEFSHLFDEIKDENNLLHLVDSDEFHKSNFFFKISLPINGKVNLEFRPASYESCEIGKYHNLDNSDIKPILQQWVGILEDYAKTLKRNNVKSYANEFYDKFKISDPNAEFDTFSSEDILKIYSGLDFFDTEIRLLSVGEENAETENSFNSISLYIKKLKESLPTLSKNRAIYKICILLAKTFAKGVPVFKKIVPEFLKMVFSELVNIGIQNQIQQFLLVLE